MAQIAQGKMFRASHKFARMAPRKVRLVADTIRGKNVNDALRILKFLPRKGARLMEKVLESAMANAAANEKVDVDSLRVARVQVNGGPMMKRWQAHARGRGVRIRRRLCHINVALQEVSEEKESK